MYKSYKYLFPIFLIFFTSIAEISIGVEGGVNLAWLRHFNDSAGTERANKPRMSFDIKLEHHVNAHFSMSFLLDYSLIKPGIKYVRPETYWDSSLNQIIVVNGYELEFIQTLNSHILTFAINPTLFLLQKDLKVNLGIGAGIGFLVRLKTDEIIVENGEEMLYGESAINKFNIPISTNLILKLSLTDKIFLSLDNSVNWEVLDVNKGSFGYYESSKNEKVALFKSKVGIHFIY